MNRITLFAGLVVTGLAGCQDPGFVGVPGIREISAAQAVSCQYVTDIRGKPGVYGPLLATQGLSYARKQVLDEARRAGANSVVFAPVSPGEPVYELRATAYRC